ncbi:radical SAM/SPASM domain-containing protein [Thiolapillus brandeum]|uniref:Radical SAM domain protein n=1 Tax=Thiolapillus brandeum TaxID=1076588 RepID=A0A7U6GLC5_9GAMM|nr:radical SAM protein [Thiolapillus brandeum]BAO45644.1 radical SAM domain protein [Thiolapillus brandeum]
MLSKLLSRRRVPAEGPDLSWVDEFIANVGPYIYVRTEDNILIKRPNQAQKLNPQGAQILKFLLDGGRIAGVIRGLGGDGSKLEQVALFLHGVRGFLEGSISADSGHPGVEVEVFDRHFSELPILSEVAITYKCNLRCVFCYAGCNCTTQPVNDEKVMTVREIETVLHKLWHEGRVPSVSFTGGEPTLHKQLPDLIAYAKELGMRVNLITNGTRIDALLAQRLKDAGLDSAQVSLEGTSAEIHNLVTQGQSSFDRTVAAVGHLKTVGIRVHTNTTINRMNVHEMPDMPRFVRQVLDNERFSMNLLVPTGSAVVHPDLIVRYSEIGAWLEKIQARSKEHGVEFLWYSPTPMCLFNPIPAGLGNHGCSACDGLISVAPNGSVIPCASYDDEVGSLLENNLVDVWNGDKARGYRDKALAHPQCRDCSQFDICNGACPLYWRELGFDELEAHNGFAPAQALGYVRPEPEAEQ